MNQYNTPYHIIQNHRGRAPEEEICVFGMVDISHNPALGYMEIVPRRDAATLLPIIQANVLAGTTIHSDEWAAYNRVQSLPGIASHETVNHSLHFVDPVTGIHTQHINRVKIKMKKMKGCHAEHLPGYLDEFMWREQHGTSAGEAYNNIIRDIAIQYPV